MKILLTTDTWVPTINGVVTSTATLRAALTALYKGRCDQPRLTGCRAGLPRGPDARPGIESCHP